MQSVWALVVISLPNPSIIMGGAVLIAVIGSLLGVTRGGALGGTLGVGGGGILLICRSEERRVGKEC